MFHLWVLLYGVLQELGRRKLWNPLIQHSAGNYNMVRKQRTSQNESTLQNRAFPNCYIFNDFFGEIFEMRGLNKVFVCTGPWEEKAVAPHQNYACLENPCMGGEPQWAAVIRVLKSDTDWVASFVSLSCIGRVATQVFLLENPQGRRAWCRKHILWVAGWTTTGRSAAAARSWRAQWNMV